jgi:hypothetical protein
VIVTPGSGTKEFATDINPTKAVEMMEGATRSDRWHQFLPAFETFQVGMRLCLEMVHHLGDVRPKDDYERRMRDLACDALDTLWTSEWALLSGYDCQSIVLLRRAFEVISLMVFFINFPQELLAWDKGKAIRPSLVRRRLKSAPISESEDILQRAYAEYCLYAHVNSETVLHRMLGDLNRFTLGCQGNLPELAVGLHLRELLAHMPWLVYTMNLFFKEEGERMGQEYIDKVLRYRASVNGANEWLSKTFLSDPD